MSTAMSTATPMISATSIFVKNSSSSRCSYSLRLLLFFSILAVEVAEDVEVGEGFGFSLSKCQRVLHSLFTLEILDRSVHSETSTFFRFKKGNPGVS